MELSLNLKVTGGKKGTRKTKKVKKREVERKDGAGESKGGAGGGIRLNLLSGGVGKKRGREKISPSAVPAAKRPAGFLAKSPTPPPPLSPPPVPPPVEPKHVVVEKKDDRVEKAPSRRNPVREGAGRVPMLISGSGEEFQASSFSRLARSSHLWRSADRFSELGLCEAVVQRLEADPESTAAEEPVKRRGLGLSVPTRTQRVAIPAALSGRDLVVRAETGSGKTLAFLLPMVHALVSEEKKGKGGRMATRAVILAPTRELCAQIADVLAQLVRPFPWIVTGTLAGGEKRKSEKARIRRGISIIVASPGRFLDHLEKTESWDLTQLRWLVVDEVDRLMDMGFEEQLSRALQLLLSRKQSLPPSPHNLAKTPTLAPWQTMLFSATVPKGTNAIACVKLRKPVFVNGDKGTSSLIAELKAKHGEEGSGEGEGVRDEEMGKGHGGRKEEGEVEGEGGGGEGEGEGEGEEEEEEEKVQLSTPAQLVQEVLPTPTKWRLVTLMAFVRQAVSVAPKLRAEARGAEDVGVEDGGKVVIFFSTVASVDFHFAMISRVWQTLVDAKTEWKLSDDGDDDKAGGGGKLSKHSNSPFRRWESSTPCLVRMHGDASRAERVAAMAAFRKSGRGVMLATDVAARGLDLPDVDVILQLDAPSEVAEYVHRVGRTARSGKGGRAVLCLDPKQLGYETVLARNGLKTHRLRSNVGVLAALKHLPPPARLIRELPKGDGDSDDEEEEGSGGGGGGESEMKSTAKSKSRPSSTASTRARKKLQGLMRDTASDSALSAERAVELAGVRWQTMAESLVEQDADDSAVALPLDALARRAFQQHVRSLAVQSKEQSHLFNVRNTHLGHLAKAFGLAQPPSAIGTKDDAQRIKDALSAYGKKTFDRDIPNDGEAPAARAPSMRKRAEKLLAEAMLSEFAA